MSTVVDELVVLIGIEGGEKAGQDMIALKGNFGILIAAAKRLVNGLEEVAKSYWEFSKATSATAEQTAIIAKQSGINTNALQELRYGVEQLGGSSRSLDSDLQSLYKNMTSQTPGQFNQGIARLGISVLDSSYKIKSMDVLLGEVADKFKQGGYLYSLQMGEILGFSPDTIRLLQNGREELDKLRQRSRDLGLVIPREQIESGNRFWRSLRDINAQIGAMASLFALKLNPVLESANRGISKFVQENRKFIQDRMDNAVDAITAAWERFKESLKDNPLKRMAEYLGITGHDLDRLVRQFVDGIEWIAEVTAEWTGYFLVGLYAIYAIWDDIITGVSQFIYGINDVDTVTGRVLNKLAILFSTVRTEVDRLVAAMRILSSVTPMGKLIGINVDSSDIDKVKAGFSTMKIPSIQSIAGISVPRLATMQSGVSGGSTPSNVNVTQNIYGTSNPLQTANIVTGMLNGVNGLNAGAAY